MFAIFVTGGKQYKVSVGDVVFVEKLGVNEGESVTFDNVLAVCGEIICVDENLEIADVTCPACGEKLGDIELCDGNCASCEGCDE